MEMWQTRARNGLDRLFRTGYPHLVNLFGAAMILALPVLSSLTGEAVTAAPGRSIAVAVVSLLYLVVWSRLPLRILERWAVWTWLYLLVQTGLIAAIYILEGGLTRFLFVLVAVQAVYLSRIRRWAPLLLGSVAALWLTLYLVISPGATGANMVAQIGMYFCYFIFAVVVSYTVVQQERQGERARLLREEVDRRHMALQELDQTMAAHSGAAERERLATTIHAGLVRRLEGVRAELIAVLGGPGVDRSTIRALRLQAKGALAAVRDAVRALRPDASDEPVDGETAPPATPPDPDVAFKGTEPIRLYHVWNLGVIIVTLGVMLAARLVQGGRPWLPMAGLGLLLGGVYGLAALGGPPWLRTLWLCVQAAVISWLVSLAADPLMCHLFLIVAAQIVFLIPPSTRALALATIFPTLLAGGALWRMGYRADWVALLSWTGAFGVTYFFAAVMAYMTRRQEEGRRQALRYAAEMAQVNHLLEVRLDSVRQMAIAAERVRMAREIHDGLGHHLTTVIVALQMAEELAEDDPVGAREHLQTADGVLVDGLHAAHQMVAELDRFERPLTVAVRELLDRWQRQNPVQVDLKMSGNFQRLPTASRMALYRALQESLTNIQKHARASRVEIQLRQLPDRVVLRVVNDDRRSKVERGMRAALAALERSTGHGPARGEGGGFGLVGLRERAEALHGSFQASALPAGGFGVEMVLPVGGERHGTDQDSAGR
jgi:signal transduction histidine kinase